MTNGLVTFTFDDGDPSLFDTAYPILKNHKMVGTAYITSDRIAGRWEDLRKMYEDGWEIGNHTKTHANLLTATNERIVQEVCISNMEFEKHGFPNVRAFAPPWGFFDDRVLGVLKSTGLVSSCRIV